MDKKTLKLAILSAASDAGTKPVHKMNLLGRPYQLGGLEFQLKVTFDNPQRALAGQAFEELKFAGLISPTYAGSIDPENWVEITDLGREAWVFPQVVCESGARRCGAWENRAGSMQEPSLRAGRESNRTPRKQQRRRAYCAGWVDDGQVLPRCYQNTPYQEDLGRHAASPNRCGLLALGRFECPEYVVRGNS